MKINNIYSLPAGLVSVVENTLHPPKASRFSVTQLIGPPLIRTLQIEKWDELETDVSDYLWMLLGIGVDNLISSAKDKESRRQHKMVVNIDEYDVVGVIDVINGNIIADWKCTSVWSFLNGIKPVWEAQLNIYNYLYSKEKPDIPIEHLKIYAILRDFQKSKVGSDLFYPKIPFCMENVDKWSEEKTIYYIQSQLRDHNNNSYRECTSEEKWQSKTTYAVKTVGKKRAERVLGSMDKATQWMAKNKRGNSIEVRTGECKRCKQYCPVRSVCKYA